MKWRERAVRWLRERGRVIAIFVVASAWVSCGRERSPGFDVQALAGALARACGGRVAAADVRWAPSGGMLRDLTLGRWVLFLARAPGEDARDVWRARVRLSPEGAPLDVVGAHDLTNTPLGDDHELVVRGTFAAFATRAYGREQSISLFDLAGEGARNRTERPADRAMAAITNLQQTGGVDGVGRIDVTLESPAAAVALELREGELVVRLDDDPRRPDLARTVRVDLARGDLVAAVPGVRADASMHLAKRFSHWAVDTLRAVPWIGPAPIAWAEDVALAARDTYRRVTFHAGNDAADVAVAAAAPPPPLDTSEASVEASHWPPPKVASIWKATEKGEGEWSPPDLPWLRKTPQTANDAPPPFQITYVRPDPDRPYAKVLLVAMDMRQLDLDLEAGVEDPEPLTGPHGPGRIPRDPAVYRRVVAAFNGAFKTEHGHYGMMVHKRVLLPPIPGAATVAVLDDGRVGFGTWGADRKIGGLLGIDDDAIVSFRQNLDPLVDRGRINPTGRSLWGFTLPGKGAQTERSGLCVTTSGHLVYAWGDDVGATALARAMQAAGCDYAMHLDMNPYHTGFLFAEIDDPAAKKFKTSLLSPAMSIPTDRYIQYSPKDFFYVLVHDPTPPAVRGESVAWRPDGGAQPPPHWLPGIWTLSTTTPEGPVQLIDVEPGRATWRLRAGALDAPASNPVRELSGDEARRVLFAVGAGISLERRPRGLGTDGRLAVPVHGGAESGVLLVGADGEMTMARATDQPPLEVHGDLLELPILLWDGHAQATPSGAAEMRAAIGMTTSGRVLLARGVFSNGEPLGSALARAGCTRALLLDRGAHASGFFHRAGGSDPPRGRYDESVLYAVASTLRPRGFRFEASTLFAQGSGAK